MGKAKDRGIILDAAAQWENEMVEYIIPGVMTKQERKSYRKQADKLHNALARERERANRKKLRAMLAGVGTMPEAGDRSPQLKGTK